MPDLFTFTAVPQKIGDRLAVVIPDEVAERCDVHEGVAIRVSIGTRSPASLLGMLKKKGENDPFDRHEEGFWPDP
jgi:antitoxin component of MazEF toxin-antitoxin module